MLVFAHRLAQLFKKSPALSCIFLTNCFMYGFGEEIPTANLCSDPVRLFSNVSSVCPSGNISCSVPGTVLVWVTSADTSAHIISNTFNTANILEGSIQLYFITTEGFPSAQCTTATAQIRTIPEQESMQGLKLTCAHISEPLSSSTFIDIKDKPSQPEGLTANPNTSTCSIFLSWTAPINNFQCVTSYIINSTFTNSTFSISNSLNHTLFVANGVVSSRKFTVSVAANDTGGRVGDWSEEVEFVVADHSSQPTDITISAFVVNVSVQLMWDVPNDTFNCVSSYLINTTASKELLSTNGTSVIITKPAEDPADTTYTVSVAAVDMSNRTGQWSDPLCFLFKVPSLIISNNSYQDCSTSSFHILWFVMPLACHPLVDEVLIAINNNELIITNNSPYILADVQVGELYVIEIVPSSALSNGSATVTTISISDYCTTTSNTFLSSMILTTSDTSTPSGTSSVVIGVIVAIAVIALTVTVFVSVVIYCTCNKKKTIIAGNTGSKEFNLDSAEAIPTSQNTAYSTVQQQVKVSRGFVTATNPAYSCVNEPQYEEVKV